MGAFRRSDWQQSVTQVIIRAFPSALSERAYTRRPVNWRLSAFCKSFSNFAIASIL